MWSKYEELYKRSLILDNPGQISRRSTHLDSAVAQRIDLMF